MKKLVSAIVILAAVVMFLTLTRAHAQTPTPTCADVPSCKAVISTAYQEVHAADAILALLSGGHALPAAPICDAKDECGAAMADRLYTAALALGQLTRLAHEVPFVGLVINGDVTTGPYSVEAVTNKSNTFVVFQVDGKDFRKEGVPKFCMFGGDIVCAAARLGVGEHTIRVTLFDKLDPTRVLAETTTSVVEPAPPAPVTP